MAEVQKQLPTITASNQPFWEAAKRHELLVYRCPDCGAAYPEAKNCTACDNSMMEWVRVSGKGQIFTFCVFHQPFHPAWKDDLPYNVAYVKLDEGPLLVSNIIDCSNEDLYIGMPVEVIFEDVTEDITLPKFRPIK